MHVQSKPFGQQVSRRLHEDGEWLRETGLPLTLWAEKDSLALNLAILFAEKRLPMEFLAALWLPILLSAVIVFIASSIMHMVLPYHKSDYRQLPDEDKILAALRPANLQKGLYVFPYCTHQNMKSPEIQDKYKQGPVGFMTIFPSGPPAMPKFLGLWFAFCLIIGLFVAYLAWHTVTPGAPYRHVFRVVGTAAFLAYGVGVLSNGIWKGQPWSNVIKEAIDGLVYALLTAGTFGWLWPH